MAVVLAAVLAYAWHRGDFMRDAVSARSDVLLPGDEGLARMSRVGPPAGEIIYQVIVDRFANGNPANDHGAGGSGPLEDGFDPTRPDFYHGGDLIGLRERLDYIQGLGVTALWLNPVLTNKPVQLRGDEVVTTGYHGYMVTDFTTVDPHLGTNDDLVGLVSAAHARGMKVYLDVTVNHTADVITYPGAGDYPAYRTKGGFPYRDVNGAPFDDAPLAGSEDFPELGPDSFPYRPVVAPDEADLKVPAWLNDVTMYHNRGNTMFTGESWTYGDWAGLDDLFTERPEVLHGLIDVYADLVRWSRVDGFRLDSARHVNLGFWQEFVPAIRSAAAQVGIPDFLLFGEVVADYYDSLDYRLRSGIPATLDFGLQPQIESLAEGHPPGEAGGGLCLQLLSDPDLSDADSDAYAAVTFVSNHDMGRIAMRLWGQDADDEGRLRRVHLAYEALFLVRGQPVIYYGDEQGFTGHAGDKAARQDMFASQTPMYLENIRLGTLAGHDVDAYDPSHPTYRLLSGLTALRRDNPALALGPTVVRVCPSTASGAMAISRIDRDTATEYVVALNNAKRPTQVTVPTWSPSSVFTSIYASSGGHTPVARADADGQVTLTVPAMGSVVLRADRPMPAIPDAPTVRIRAWPRPASGWLEVGADVTSTGWATAAFYLDPDGPGPLPRALVAVDDAALVQPIVTDTPDGVLELYPFAHRVPVPVHGLAEGDPIELIAVVRDGSGHEASAHLDMRLGRGYDG